MTRKQKPPAGFDENPEWTKDMFAKATGFPPGTSLLDAAAAMKRGRGRPKSESPKEAIKLRIDADVIASYRRTGAGWQTRMNDDLRKASKRLKA